MKKASEENLPNGNKAKNTLAETLQAKKKSTRFKLIGLLRPQSTDTQHKFFFTRRKTQNGH